VSGSIGEITKDWLEAVCARLDQQSAMIALQSQYLKEILAELVAQGKKTK
jgi:hypothetical protein